MYFCNNLRRYQQQLEHRTAVDEAKDRATGLAARVSLWISDKLSGRQKKEDEGLKQAREWFREQRERQSLEEARQFYLDHERKMAMEAAAAEVAAAAAAAEAERLRLLHLEEERIKREAEAELRRRQEEERAELLKRLEAARGQDLEALLPPHMRHVLDDCVGQFEGEARAHVASHFCRFFRPSAFFTSTNPFTICRNASGWVPHVIHVEMSPCLMSRGSAFVRYMRARLLALHSVPEYLWHGTAGSNIADICENGFDPSKRRGQAHGPGEYFSPNSNFSDGYSHADASGCKRMLLCSVLPGPHTQKADENIVVVNNPADRRLSYCLPVCVVTYSTTSEHLRYVSPFSQGRNSLRVLFHQTTKEGAEGITQSGFDLSRANPSGIAGRGIYFCTHPKSSFHKCHGKVDRIIIALVRVGCSLDIAKVGDKSLNLQRLLESGCDSVRIPRNDAQKRTNEDGAECVVPFPQCIFVTSCAGTSFTMRCR